MPIEVKTGESIYLDAIEYHDFKIPLISRMGDGYFLNNLHPLPNWDQKIETKRVDIKSFCNNFNILKNDRLNGQVLYDEDTNLITEVTFNIPNIQSSRVYLDQRFSSRSGSYIGENIYKLSTAILYQNFLSRYLSFITDNKTNYSYIEGPIDMEYHSANLTVPKKILDLSKKNIVTGDGYREDFPLKANNICGQFSTTLQEISYTESGLIQSVRVDGDSNLYHLSNGTYYPHHADSPFQAAALHGIVAEFLNDIIERKSNSK